MVIKTHLGGTNTLITEVKKTNDIVIPKYSGMEFTNFFIVAFYRGPSIHGIVHIAFRDMKHLSNYMVISLNELKFDKLIHMIEDAVYLEFSKYVEEGAQERNRENFTSELSYLKLRYSHQIRTVDLNQLTHSMNTGVVQVVSTGNEQILLQIGIPFYDEYPFYQMELSINDAEKLIIDLAQIKELFYGRKFK